MKALCAVIQVPRGDTVDLMPGESIGRGAHRLTLTSSDVPRRYADVRHHNDRLWLHARSELGLHKWEKDSDGSWIRPGDNSQKELELVEGLVFGLAARVLARVMAVQIPSLQPRFEVSVDGETWHTAPVDPTRRNTWLQPTAPYLRLVRTPEARWHLWGHSGDWYVGRERLRPTHNILESCGAQLRTTTISRRERAPTAPTERICQLEVSATKPHVVRVTAGAFTTTFTGLQAKLLQNLAVQAYRPVARPRLISSLYGGTTSADANKFRSTLERINKHSEKCGLPALFERCNVALEQNDEADELPEDTHLRLSPEVAVLGVVQNSER